MSSPEYLVATEPLHIGTARAHNAGDLVLGEAVKRNGWTAQTAKPGTKAAEKAAEPEPTVATPTAAPVVTAPPRS